MYKNSVCKYFILVSLISSLFGACKAQKQISEMGILKGTIGVYEGNCMPSPGVPPCEPRPFSTRVLVTELSQDFEADKMIAETVSDSEGQYILTLPAGTYSLFLEDGEQVVCTLIQCPSSCYCQPFMISKDSTTIVDSTLDHATW